MPEKVIVEQAMDKRRLRDILPTAVEGEPDYWYGVVDGFGGALWPQLYLYKHEADKAATDLQGQVVIVAARILEDEDGERIEPDK